MELEIVLHPNPILTRKSKPIDVVDDSVRELAEAMLELMDVEYGIGLAAPQVGISKRLIVVGFPDEDIPPQALINPKVVIKRGVCVLEEGCLSFPGIHAPVKRPEEIKVIAKNLEGEDVEIEATGIFARVLQHEIDHLNGIVFIQYLSPVQRIKWRRTLKDLEEKYNNPE